jgi:hypothetical protein
VTLSTTPIPAIPLTPDLRASYQEVYAKNQKALEEANDFELVKQLNASQLQIGGLLSADDQYRLHADTALFQSMLTQIKATNDGLKTLQDKIGKIEGGISKFADVLGAVSQVLSFFPI